MRSIDVLVVLVGLVVVFLEAKGVNDRPIIGILTQPTYGTMAKFGQSYIVSNL